MSIVILKFGGTLLETPDKIGKAAQYVIKSICRGEKPVVVVSAPGKTTDEFHRLAKEITSEPDQREMDMLLSVGERTAMALLAMSINADGRYHAISFTGSQVGIITDTQHTDARILEVKGYRIRETVEKGHIPIIAGFQGVSVDREITTLGRGGSDTTAIALAIALKAERCELVKEYGGVYSADPEIIPEAKKYNIVDYETLQAFSDAGAGVVQAGAAVLARQHSVPLKISGVEDETATFVSNQSVSEGAVAGIVLEKNLFILKLYDSEILQSNNWCFTFKSKDCEIFVVRKCPETFDCKPIEMVSVLGWNRRIPGKVLTCMEQSDIHPIAVQGQIGVIYFLFARGEGERASQLIHDYCLEQRLIKQC